MIFDVAEWYKMHPETDTFKISNRLESAFGQAQQTHNLTTSNGSSRKLPKINVRFLWIGSRLRQEEGVERRG